MIRRGGTCARILIAGMVFCAGCDLLHPYLAEPSPPPDLPVITEALESAWQAEGHGRVVFLGTEAGSLDDASLAEAMALLSAALQTPVCPESEAELGHPDYPLLTPVLASTGQPGVMMRVTCLAPGSDGTWLMRVLLSRSCSERMEIEYRLAQDGCVWTIVDCQIEPDLWGCY